MSLLESSLSAKLMVVDGCEATVELSGLLEAVSGLSGHWLVARLGLSQIPYRLDLDGAQNSPKHRGAHHRQPRD